MIDPSVVILAGGLATRLRPLTEKIPKSMIAIGGRPFIEHQLEVIKKQGFKKVIICVGYLGETVEAHIKGMDFNGLDIQFRYDGNTLLGTGGAIKKVLNDLSERFIVIYGDSYLKCEYRDIVEYFDNKRGKSDVLGLMTVFENNGMYDKSNVVFKDNEIVTYDKRNSSKDMLYIDWGFNVLTKSAFEILPNKSVFDLSELLVEMVRRTKLAGYEVLNRFYEIGSRKGIEDLEVVLKNARNNE